MICKRCNTTGADAALGEAWHEQHRAAEATFTCEDCFAEVRESSRAAHRWWHAGLAELVRVTARAADQASSRRTTEG